MPLIVRCSIASLLLLLAVGCGVTEDEVSEGTTTTTTTSAAVESTTSTTEDDDSGNDPELADLLLTGDDFGPGLEADPDDGGSPFEGDLRERGTFTAEPTRHASIAFATSDETSYVAESIGEYGATDDASLFIEELQTLNEECRAAGEDEVIAASFEPVDDLGDEAIRALPDPSSTVGNLEVIAVRTGARAVLLISFGAGQLLSNAVIAEAVDRRVAVIGVGPHPEPWPDDERLDPDLLASGDTRNVVDRYRYWRMEAIVADLDRRRHPFHVAIENWEHDRNIGTIVRTANAFLAAEVHIVGRRRWNRRGAMVTEQYQHLRHHDTIEDLVGWASAVDLPVVGVDILPGAVPIERAEVPERCLLLFGQEGPGLSGPAREAASVVVSIPQYGSTRSLNAGVAAGIAMHEWVRRWALPADGR